jgi:16S rRNA (uracil1498-N3)-methyltransferase
VASRSAGAALGHGHKTLAHRYFVEPPIQGGQVLLAGAEAHHLQHVMRARPGDEITLFDGSGREFRARIERLSRGEVGLAILSRAEVDRELPLALTLGAALPKGDRQRWLVEKCVELGLSRLVPLQTARGVAQPTAAAVARLRRAVIEASKQCGRTRLMECCQPLPLAGFLQAAPPHALKLMAHSGGIPAAAIPAAAPPPPGAATQSPAAWLAVGPEGGFTEDELAAARRAGWQPVDLGPRTLRVETAALLLVSLVALRAGAGEPARAGPTPAGS